MEQQKLSYDSNEVSKVLRTNDSKNDAAFEVRVSKAGSSISILTLNCRDGSFINTVSTRTLYAGIIRISGSQLFVNDKPAISFEYIQSGSTVTATLYNNWSSNEITIKITDSSGNAYKLKNLLIMVQKN